jgi:hypothetical protein
MPSSTRIKGRNLVLTLDGDDYAIDASSITLTNEDQDGEVRTFADITPPKQWFFEIEGIQSTDSGSLWDFLWDNDGTEAISFVFKPHGNATASASQPHFTGTVDVKGKPPIGGSADTTFVFSYRLDLVSGTEPTKVTS